MKVLFVRHSESMNNIKALKQGRGCTALTREDDPTISALGVDQASRLGKYFKEMNVPISSIETSPYLRTLQTT